MGERVAFLKHIFSGARKESKPAKKAEPEKPVSATESAVDLMSLRREAIDVLFGEYEDLRKRAGEAAETDLALAEELVEEINKKLDEIEALKNSEDVVIDDLEKILARAPRSADQPGAGAELGERTVSEVVEMTPEGKEVRIELAELARHWNAFYKKHKINWVKPIPEDIKLTEEQAKEMRRQIKELGHDWPIIIPEGLTGQPEFEEYEAEEEDPKTKRKIKVKKLRLKKPAEHYKELHELMSHGYKDKTYYGDNYKNDGNPAVADGVGASEDRRTGLRIVMARKVKEIKDDNKLKQTINKSVDDLEAKGGLFEEWGVEGMTEAEYLIFQRAYYEETGEHLDVNYYIWLAGSKRLSSGRAPVACWHSGVGGLHFSSYASVRRHDDEGCRPVGSFKL